MNENRLIIFVKNPAPGIAKKRLSQHIGAENAARIYKNISEMVIEKTTPQRNDIYEVAIFFTPLEAKQLIKEWLINNTCFYPQQGNDLGERMMNAFKRAFEGDYKKAILIGSDCPDLSRDIILQGFVLLASKDVVLGPACDGGYYLIGMNKLIPELFSDIAWGTATVLQQTKLKTKQADLSLGLLPMLRDIDRVKDLQHYHFL
jgi:rSAM/selenodomain-associated transferase 1